MTQQEELAIVPAERIVSLGVLPADGPADVITQATAIATQLAGIIRDRRLYTRISGKDFVRVEGWSTLGAMLGVLPREVEVKTGEDGTYEAVVELVRTGDGAIVGRASAICGLDEKQWAKRPSYARRSMAVTRATGKAYRLGFSWIMALAGYEPTPAEEIIDAEFETKPTQKRGGNGKGNNPPAPHSDYDPITDIEALILGKEFNEYAVQELGFNSIQHVVATLNQELGQAWGKRFAKTHLWKTLEAHQAAKATDGG